MAGGWQWYQPNEVLKVVRYEVSSSRGTCQFPLWKSTNLLCILPCEDGDTYLVGSVCDMALWLQPCSKGLGLSRSMAFACLFCLQIQWWHNCWSMVLLLWQAQWHQLGSCHPVVAWTAACWWTGTVLAGKHLGGTLGSTFMWYGSPGNLPSPSSISGKYFMIWSLDVAICLVKTLVVCLMSTVLDISVASSSMSLKSIF